MKSNIEDKDKLVNSSQKFIKIHLMNDLMSLGVHRILKEKSINWMNLNQIRN